MRHTVDNPGRVRRLTAAIVVNDRLTQPASKNHPAVWQRRSADEVRNLTALAQAAVGFDASRGDVLTIEDLAFDDNLPQPGAGICTTVTNAAEDFRGAGRVLGVAHWSGCGGGLRPSGPRGAALGDKKRQGGEGTPCQNRGAGCIGGSQTCRRSGTGADSGIFEQVTTHLKGDRRKKFAPVAELDPLRVDRWLAEKRMETGVREGNSLWLSRRMKAEQRGIAIRWRKAAILGCGRRAG